MEKYTITELKEVESLDGTVRGDGGFGSTGLKHKKRTLKDYFKRKF